MSAEARPDEVPDLRPVSGYTGGPEMTLLDHLRELRNRAIVCAAFFLVALVVSFIFWEQILELLLRPGTDAYQERYGPDAEFRLIALSPLDTISIAISISMSSSLLIASPVLIWQFLAFVVPGLTPRERRAIFPGLIGVVLFMLAGMAFAYFIVLPASLGFLFNFGDAVIDPRPGVKQYISFVTRLVFWIGVAFELPMVMALMARLGLVRARQMLAFWRYAIVLAAIVAAIVTPTPDPVTMSYVLGPLILLYYVGIAMAWVVQPRRKSTA